MTAGRELDALVAEKVMGWRRMTYAEQYPGNPNFAHRNELTGYWHDAVGKYCARAEDCPDYYAPEDAWSPSTDIAAAWEVVEKLCATGTDEERYFIVRREAAEYVVTFWREALAHNVAEEFESRAKNAPLAIALAALKAVGATPPE